MRARTSLGDLQLGQLNPPPRSVPRVKRSVGTSLCAGASVSWAFPRRGHSSYHFPSGCFCLTPEHHGAQFQQDQWPDSWKGRGRC